MHAQRQQIIEILTSLHLRFGENLQAIDDDSVQILERIDEKNRKIIHARDKIQSKYTSDPESILECIDILSEVFSDITQAMYLISAGLLVPGRMVTRRALETGLAVVYFWDQPHEYWAWTKHDSDLSFSAMVGYLSSSGYRSHLTHVSGSSARSEFPTSEIQSLYRVLSNTVHGKFDTLTPLSPSRFDVRKNGVEKHLLILEKTSETVMRAIIDRFHFASDTSA